MKLAFYFCSNEMANPGFISISLTFYSSTLIVSEPGSEKGWVYSWQSNSAIKWPECEEPLVLFNDWFDDSDDAQVT